MQGTPSCLTCPLPESHQPCSSDSELRVPQTIAMAHIASCMRPDAIKASVYISQETSSRTSVSVSHPPPSSNESSLASSCMFTEGPAGHKRLQSTKCNLDQEPLPCKHHTARCLQISALAVSEKPSRTLKTQPILRQAGCPLCRTFLYLSE